MAHAPFVAIPKHGGRLGQGFNKGQQLKAMEAPGRQTNPRRGYQTPVAFISDRLALRQVLILCNICAPKFAPVAKRARYRLVFIPDQTGVTDGYTVNGQCDSCAQETVMMGGGRAYQPEELYAKTHLDPSEARRAARAAAKSLSTWQFLEHRRRREEKHRV